MGVVDAEGFVVACSELSLIGSKIEDFRPLSGETLDKVFSSGNKTYKLLGGSNAQQDYTVFAEGKDPLARSICIMASVAFNEAKANYEEKHNKSAFVKNIISDNILPGDVYARAKELHFTTDIPRAVFLVRKTDKNDPMAIETVSNLFPDRQKDFVLTTAETDRVLIKELTPNQDAEALAAMAKTIENALMTDFTPRTVIGIGTVANHLRELADRFKEAQVAIEVGKIFETEKTIINYETLGIGRIVYQLPNTLCEMFLSEVFKKNPIESLDQETLFTINKFFENSLNVSETSRKLFVHRNTLVYRLEKIKKLTGLDLREFEHAIVFKVALMVKKYLNSQGGRY
jgi:carbohydrate diacid regulator